MYEKLKTFIEDPLWTRADKRFRRYFSVQAEKLRLTVQQIRNCLVMQCDFDMWDMPGAEEIWKDFFPDTAGGKNLAERAVAALEKKWNEYKNRLTEYPEKAAKVRIPRIRYSDKRRDSVILGRCPVASDRTRCCNLQTMDAVMNCGFGCSYCSIQTFNVRNTVYFDPDLVRKLDQLELDPKKRYHIGTGQSSDSLMWGNRGNMLGYLLDFAWKHPNVVLEFKTKSKNIRFLEHSEIPPNVIVTWSLNTQKIIDNEEHGTAPLSERIDCAARIAAKKTLVGFHFHPVIMYRGWEDEYAAIAERLKAGFDPDMVCMVSFGTLTFIKPVIKALRAGRQKSRVLQIPLAEAEGKFSYTFAEKLRMFSALYNSFTDWHKRTWFYLCMEDADLWKPVFGYEYESNQEFETAMIDAYFRKIRSVGKK